VNGAYADDPRLRFRIWVDGRLRDEAWIDTTDPGRQAKVEAVQLRQAGIARQASEDKLLWMSEVYDPAQPDNTAYIRWGTDKAGMVAPMETDDPVRTITELFLPDP